MHPVLGIATVLAFGALVLCTIWNGLLAFYLDMRRTTLVGTGQLPESTPKFFHIEPSSMRKAAMGYISMNRGYIFSKAINENPDAATRWWAPVLRMGVISGRLLGVIAAGLFAVYLVSGRF